MGTIVPCIAHRTSNPGFTLLSIERVAVEHCGLLKMGNDIEAAAPHTTRISEDASSIKPLAKVGREELADIVPPHESYEGRHRFDPHASWTVEEERRVVRKTDLRLLTWLCLMMFGLQVSLYALQMEHEH
jgi:hypothetical protein